MRIKGTFIIIIIIKKGILKVCYVDFFKERRRKLYAKMGTSSILASTILKGRLSRKTREYSFKFKVVEGRNEIV